MKYTEVEQKYQLLSPPDDLKATLTDRGATPGTATRQIDTYYNAPHRDFLGSEIISEWLRVRVADDGSSLNFKTWYPLNEKIKTHCDEFETTIGDAEAVQRLLAALNFTNIATVDKIREEWHADGVAVAFDTVAGLGNFIEFEYKGHADTTEAATKHLDTFIAGLDIKLGDRINTGYPHMVLGLAPAMP